MEKLKNYIKKYDLASNHDLTLLLILLLSISWYKLAPLFLILLSVLIVLKGKKNKLVQLINIRSGAFWAICFFVLHILGMVWTKNTGFGWSDVGMKVSFVVLPVILLFGNFNFSLRDWLFYFTKGLTYLVIGMLVFSAWRSWYYPEDNNWGYFFETEFSIFIHRSYWATYSALAASFVLFEWINHQQKKINWYLFSWILLSLSTFLTISKAGIIIWSFLTIIVIIYYLFSSKKYYILSIIGSATIGLLLFLFFANTRISERFQEIPKAFSHVHTTNNNTVESNEARIVMWSTSLKLIREYWLFGTGTGDVKDALIQKNLELGNLEIAERRLNAHNQFLNTWLQLGVFGLFSLLMMFVTTWINSNKNHSFYGKLFVLAMVLTMLFESFLETQAGIVPFCILLTRINLSYSIESAD